MSHSDSCWRLTRDESNHYRCQCPCHDEPDAALPAPVDPQAWLLREALVNAVAGTIDGSGMYVQGYLHGLAAAYGPASVPDVLAGVPQREPVETVYSGQGAVTDAGPRPCTHLDHHREPALPAQEEPLDVEPHAEMVQADLDVLARRITEVWAIDEGRLARALGSTGNCGHSSCPRDTSRHDEEAREIAAEYRALGAVSEGEPPFCPECGGQYSDLPGHRQHAHAVSEGEPET